MITVNSTSWFTLILSPTIWLGRSAQKERSSLHGSSHHFFIILNSREQCCQMVCRGGLGSARDYHYPVCRLDIRQDSEFATGYGIQKLLSNVNRIRIRISEMLLSIFRGFRLLEKVAHCTIVNLLSSEASLQPSAPWLRVCLWCNLWTVELCQVYHHESVPGVAR